MWSACPKTWNKAIKTILNNIIGTVNAVLIVMVGYYQWNYKTSRMKSQWLIKKSSLGEIDIKIG